MTPPVGRFAEVAYRFLLRFYPRAFRERNGDEMLRLFAEKGRDTRETGGTARLAAHWLCATADCVKNGIGERLDEGRERRRVAGTPMGNTRRNYRGGGGVDSFMKDIKYAARTLFKNPGFSWIAIVTIALGIGANTAIFSVVRAVLLQPLPYDEPEELVLLWGEMRNRGVTHFPSSPPDYRDYRDGAEALEGLAGISTFPVSLTGDDDPIQVNAAGVTTNFFEVLGIEPVLGRSFVEEDGAPNPPGALPGQAGTLPGMVVLSHALWQQRFGGDPDALGRTIQIGGGASEIVGVMPPGFELYMPHTAGLAQDVEVWFAQRIDFENSPRNNVFLRLIGRLRDGATPEQLQAQVDRISATLVADDETKATAGYAMRVEELHADLTAGVRPVLLALFGAVVFVLLIACANVSNLLLVRASGRDRELAVRAAMGGSRSRLVRQMLIESGLLAFVGAAVGVVLASGGISLLLALQPDDLPRIDSVQIDGAVLLFTMLSAVAAAALFGMVPAIQSSGFELADALKDRSGASSSAARKLIRNTVVIGEVAMSLVLLIGAGLMVRSFVELNSVSPGYDPAGVITFNAAPPFARFPQAVDRANFMVEMQDRLESIPGVVRASSVFPLPLTGNLFNGRYGTEEALTDPEAFGQATYRVAAPGYFETMGTTLLAGRTFTPADNADSASVVVVDAKLAGVLWPNESAIGKRFLVRVTTPEPVWVEVVGVVEHQRAEDLAVEGPETVYFTDRYVGSFGGTWVVKAGSDPAALMGAIRAEVQALDPDIPVASVELMQTYVDRAMGPTRFALTLIGVFGAIALVLASVGLYGVLSFVVRQRTAEIGVRMAFGAEAGAILKLVVGQGLMLAGGGLGLGLLVALSVSSVMDTLLVGISPTDPARRATHVNPVTALRDD
jgi:putative ABC transport system permease protein